MTEKQLPPINKLRDGRELDAAVAREVFGLVIGPSRRDPTYSTDWNEAVRVVEEMLRWGGYRVFIESGDGVSWAEFWLERPDNDIFKAQTTSLPSAICRAALKAVRGEREAEHE